MAVALYFWRSSPVGIIALAVLCVGDGMAEVVGRGGWSITRLPWNRRKVIALLIVLVGHNKCRSRAVALSINQADGVIRRDALPRHAPRKNLQLGTGENG